MIGKRVLVTGASGFVGRALTTRLTSIGGEALPLKRDLSAGPPLDNADALVHLAGESIAAIRWSAQKKQKIRDSRVLGTRAIVEAVGRLAPERRPRALICASAIGYYGDRGEEELFEGSPPGKDFLAEVVQQWEHEALRAQALGIRVVCLRSGLVLGKNGGALERMPPLRVGRAMNWVSWIHLEDIVRFIVEAVGNPEIKGVYNLVAPSPVRSRDFHAGLARAKGWPGSLWIPQITIEAAMGEVSTLLLASQKVSCDRAQKAGFRFRFGNLREALNDIFG